MARRTINEAIPTKPNGTSSTSHDLEDGAVNGLPIPLTIDVTPRQTASGSAGMISMRFVLLDGAASAGAKAIQS
jgi:hypothetical protein